jgi:hypothetical protein
MDFFHPWCRYTLARTMPSRRITGRTTHLIFEGDIGARRQACDHSFDMTGSSSDYKKLGMRIRLRAKRELFNNGGARHRCRPGRNELSDNTLTSLLILNLDCVMLVCENNLCSTLRTTRQLYAARPYSTVTALGTDGGRSERRVRLRCTSSGRS